jgi:hypothetical protein
MQQGKRENGGEEDFHSGKRFKKKDETALLKVPACAIEDVFAAKASARLEAGNAVRRWQALFGLDSEDLALRSFNSFAFEVRL